MRLWALLLVRRWIPEKATYNQLYWWQKTFFGCSLIFFNPTYEYGVAFERGVAVDYGDRRHIYISGTASIDNKGKIVAPGDIVAQTNRMLENISVLLKEGDCSWDDVAHMIVYLRDISDYGVVKGIMNDRFSDIPKAIVLAHVCRPGLLIETECIAIKQIEDKEYEPF